MAAVLLDCQSPLERSQHTAFIDRHTLYVWGGYQLAAGEDRILPSNRIWECDLHSGQWVCRAIEGDAPSELSGSCGSFLNGSLYVFAGCDPEGFTNQFFSVDLAAARYTWRRITDTSGTTPSPRDKHTCWVHKDRLIYFGGYGCKTIQEVRNTTTLSFLVEETSWAAIGATYFRCWGWNNEVNVFDTQTHSWSMPDTQGPAPSPRASHASAVLGTRGFICGGLDSKDLDLYSLDLETWTWTYYDLSSSRVPIGRSMHTLTPTSDHTLLLYGGFGLNPEGVDPSRARSDAWQFDTLKKEWLERSDHPHQDKPRLWHSACRGDGDQVVVFGGSSDFCIQLDSMAVLRSPLQRHHKDVFFFQTQPSSLSRLSEDAMATNQTVLTHQLSCLPRRLLRTLSKRLAYFSRQHPGAPAEHPEAPAEHPEAPAGHPEAPAGHPGAPAEHPEAPAEHPGAPAEHPEAPAEHPAEAPAEHPEAPAEHPEAPGPPAGHQGPPAGHPEAPAEHPEAPAGAPEAPAEHPEAPAGHPAEAPAGHPAEAPAGHPAEAPAGHPAEAPAGHPAAAPAGHPAEVPAGHPAAAPAEHPEAPAGHPAEVPAGHPEAPAGHPEAPAGHPEAPAGHPEAPAGHPEAPAGHPEAPAGHPEAPAGHPEAPAGHPEAPAGHPEASA